MIEILETTSQGSKKCLYNGVIFWANADNVIMYIPSNNWAIVEEMLKNNLIIKKFYKYLYGYTEFLLK